MNTNIQTHAKGQHAPPALIDGISEQQIDNTAKAHARKKPAAKFACGAIHSTGDMPQAVLDAGYEAANTWYADMLDRIDDVVQSESARQGREIISGYCVDHGLHKAFVATPIAQRGAFLDAVGAYLMTFLAYGKPTREFRVTTDRLAMYASTPAEQDAWDDRHNDEGVTA